jgi:hypothetical protein
MRENALDDQASPMGKGKPVSFTVKMSLLHISAV